MYSNEKDMMFSIGYATVALYLISLIFFLLGAVYPNWMIVTFAVAAMFFTIPSVIIAVMVKMRIGT